MKSKLDTSSPVEVGKVSVNASPTDGQQSIESHRKAARHHEAAAKHHHQAADQQEKNFKISLEMQKASPIVA